MPLKKEHIISILIFLVTYLVPFRYAVLYVKADNHWLSAFGVLFTAVGFVAGFYYLVKGGVEKDTHNHSENSGH